MTKVIIIEDEELAVSRLKEMLLSISPNIRIIRQLDSIADSIEFLSSSPSYDLIFMDINLADGNSFDIFRHVTITKPIIFTTAYDEYAIEAFKQFAVDYLLKPIKKDLLGLALQKYEKYFRGGVPDYSLLTDNNINEKKWLIKIGQNIRTISYKDVAYYFTTDKITYLVNFEGKKYPVDHTLEYIETNITDKSYFRINRQYIINHKAVGKMQTHTKSRVKINLLPTNEEVITSTERSPLFKKWLVG
ncbi:MAG: response regulator transcription factor [Saprospiraceae bacterium]|nr:response regulator transcription factor [Saprospiraceae bacterium]